MKKFKELSDLGLVTAFITLGYSPMDRHKNGKRVLFSFEWDEEMQRIKEDFFNNGLEVDARTYHTTMKSLKNSIYQMED